MVAFLEKSTGSAGFHQVINFLNRSHICYALTKKLDVYVSFIKQFWRSAEASTDDNREVQITATIDGHSMSITEASLRRHLKLDDQDGITSIPNSEIFEQLALMGYHTDSDKLTFQKGAFSPQWRFLIHNILHCLSPKKTEQHIPTPYDSPLHAVHSHGSDEGSLKLNELTNLVTKLSDRVAVLEDDLRKTKKTYSSALTKLILRVKKFEARVKIGKSRKRAKVVLSEDDADVEDDSSKQGRKLSDAEVQEKASTETEPIIQEVTPTEVIQDQGSSEKGSAEISTACATKGKGNAIMTETEPVKKSKKLLEQERLSLEEAIRLQEQVDEEERAQVARDEEIARQPLAVDEERVTTEPKITKDNDWNDPSVQNNYKMNNFKGMSYAEIRPIFEKVWDYNHNFVPMDLDIEKEKKPAEFQQIEKEQVELDDEKEDLKGYLDIVPREEVAVDVDFLSTKYLIVDWKTYTLSENFMLVKERYSSSKPEGYDLMLWGDLHTLFEPDEESEIWMNQNEYNLISWSLCDLCGVYILLMQNGISIHMLTEKKYPLSQEMILKMLNKRLEVDHESTQAYELLKFIRSKVQK
ncbi:hypothetical protein Tco_0092265 [Tanacetum coccineum]